MLGPVTLLLALIPALTDSEASQERHDVRASDPDASVDRLADEVRGKGWIVFSARSERGDWDLFACRPDGSERRNVTNTPDSNEAATQFSRDGRRLLFRRIPRDETIDGNRYGTQGVLIIASADGTRQTPFGEDGEYPWATWSPDGNQLACLSIKGISIVDVNTHRVVRTLPRKGFFQQLTWSPDGRWLSGVSNSFGASWSVGRIDIATGEASAISGADCCTPDWFPESRMVIYSNRPGDQKENNGIGWTQLWRADADGRNRRLVYGEDGRHVYGGHVSPDGKYVLFTGNMREDGDPSHSGSPMGLLRLADAPVIGGDSQELRKLHPARRMVRRWCFTQGGSHAGRSLRSSNSQKLPWVERLPPPTGSRPSCVRRASSPSAPRQDAGDWDLFMMRPDGSGTATDHPLARVPRGRRSVLPRWEKNSLLSDSHQRCGRQQHLRQIRPCHCRCRWIECRRFRPRFPVGVVGAGWTQLACLDRRGVRIIDVASRKEVRQLPRKGIVQQLVWSPDGASFAGTANGLGPYWNIGRLDAKTGTLIAVSDTERYNCTPDWRPDSRSILYSRGIVPETGGHAEIWMAAIDGKEKRMLCAEEGRHLYGACSSPDGKYLLFTRSEADLGKVDNSRTRLAIVRISDTPIATGTSSTFSQQYPGTRPGPILDLSWGWEPHWTSANLEATK